MSKHDQPQPRGPDPNLALNQIFQRQLPTERPTHPGHEAPMSPSFTPPPPSGRTRHRTHPMCHRPAHPPLPRRRAERVAISRSIVIFADYLSDLAVLDALSDITASAHPQTTATVALLGAAAGVLAADLLTGLAAVTAATLPDGTFDVFGRPRARRIVLRTRGIDIPSARVSVNPGVRTVKSAVETEVKSVVEVVSSKRDLLERLVNSCFVTTPPLTVFTGWAADATGDSAVFAEAFFVVLLSLSALAPILRAGGKDCESIARLRRWGLLKNRDVGWCQVCGFWDGVLDWGFRRGAVTRRSP